MRIFSLEKCRLFALSMALSVSLLRNILDAGTLDWKFDDCMRTSFRDIVGLLNIGIEQLSIVDSVFTRA